MARLDPHSYNDSDQPETRALTWRASVNFERRQLEAEVLLELDRESSGPLDLDTRDLEIVEVTDEKGRGLSHQLFPPEPILGSRLRVELAKTRTVRVRYRTSPGASALQWLEPAQTAGGRAPFLFSQCQAIHARSVVPLQDTPRIRIRYTAELTIPASLRAVMAARAVGREEQGATAVERFELPEPIPPYLFALAVGNLASRELGPRSRVWAEPEVVDAAAHEFAGVDAMLGAAEAIFGAYPWERFDVLAMPPSFPYGGMENPRLTFLTPTVLAGDRSLVNVLVHELAHSWTGNLVSNASAEHFWLNEGCTVYAERRILEALEGRELAELHAALGRRALDEELIRFERRPELTLLRTRLKGVDPDEAYSQVPYEKGYFFLRALEEAAGRDAFSAFLREYVEKFRFQSITTDDFLALAKQRIPEALRKVGADRWVDGAGVPADAPRPRSKRLDAIGSAPEIPTDAARGWTATEWQLFLESRPRPAPQETCRALDERFHLTQSHNAEVLGSWLELGIASNYAPAVKRARAWLGEVGRMKYLRPLYRALAANPATKGSVRETFQRWRSRYHPIAAHVVDAALRDVGA